jgi:ABC-type transport system substrate-binding protein
MNFPRLSRIARFACLIVLNCAIPSSIAASDPNKVIRMAIEAQDAGFDPVVSSNYYSGMILEAVGESLLTYDYLARPAKLVPLVAEEMPKIEDEGRTYTFKIRKGVYFAPDNAFSGKKRELIADDFVFSIKRYMDPKLRSQWKFLFGGKIVGLDALSEAAEKTGNFDYVAPVEGLQAPDKYTLRIKLNKPDYNFSYILAMSATVPVAREVVEKYGIDLAAHIVGTNAYMLKTYDRGRRMILEANPNYRGFKWNFTATDDPIDADVVKAMQGKSMPQIGRVEINIIEEEQSKYLAFAKGQLDYVFRIGNIAESWRDSNDIKPELKKAGITRQDSIDAETTFHFFNFRDPVTGGFSKERIALRRALIMAYPTHVEAETIRRSQAIPNQMPIPRGVVGYNPKYRAINQYNPDAANKLLDKFGYKRGADGFRSNPDGSPLEITLNSEPTQVSGEYDKLWSRSFEKVGVRMNVKKGTFAENQKAAHQCQIQFWGSAWAADYPDGENFFQLLYGPNSMQSNNGCYDSPAFNRMYEAALKMPDSPQRNALYDLMVRQVEYDGAWSFGVSRIRSILIHKGIQGYKKHPMLHTEWKYMDIDLPARASVNLAQ